MFNTDFVLTSRIVNNLKRINENNSYLENVSIEKSLESKLKLHSLIKTVGFTKEIQYKLLELSDEEIEDLLNGYDVLTYDKYKHKIRNYKKVLHYINKKDPDINLRTINTINRVALKNIKEGGGKIRDFQMEMYRVENGRKRIFHMPPEPHLVHSLVKDLVKWINTSMEEKKLPILIIAGIAHYKLVRIHPYVDGNGRTARALTTLILNKGKINTRKLYSLEEDYGKDIKKYLSLAENWLKIKNSLELQEKDLTGWLEYFTGSMARVTENKRRIIKITNKEG